MKRCLQWYLLYFIVRLIFHSYRVVKEATSGPMEFYQLGFFETILTSHRLIFHFVLFKIKRMHISIEGEMDSVAEVIHEKLIRYNCIIYLWIVSELTLIVFRIVAIIMSAKEVKKSFELNYEVFLISQFVLGLLNFIISAILVPYFTVMGY